MKNAYEGGEIRKPHIPKAPPPDDDPIVDFLIVAMIVGIPTISLLVAVLRPYLPF